MKPVPTTSGPQPVEGDRQSHRPSNALLKVAEVAELLAISPRTLWVLTNRGDIASVKIGKATRYRPGDVDAFVRRHTRPKR